MLCPYCKTDKPVRFFDKKQYPILVCGHGLFPEGTDERLAEDICANINTEITAKADQLGVSFEDAQKQVITEGFEELSKKKKVSLLRTLNDAGLTSPEVQQAEESLSSISKRYVKRDL